MAKLTVKCSDVEYSAWMEAAWKEKLSLSEWVRRQLNETSTGIPVPVLMREPTPTKLDE